MRQNKINFFTILLTILALLMVVIGCATTPSIKKYEEQSFDTKTRIYENHEIGFQIWFPKEYKVYIDEHELKKMAKRQKIDWKPWMKLRAINEKEYTQILMGIEKTSMGLKEYFEASLRGLPKGLKVISTGEDQINGIQYVEYIASGINPGGQHVKMRSCCFELPNYKVHFTFFSLANFYNNIKIEEIIHSFRRSQ